MSYTTDHHERKKCELYEMSWYGLYVKIEWKVLSKVTFEMPA